MYPKGVAVPPRAARTADPARGRRVRTLGLLVAIITPALLCSRWTQSRSPSCHFWGGRIAQLGDHDARAWALSATGSWPPRGPGDLETRRHLRDASNAARKLAVVAAGNVLCAVAGGPTSFILGRGDRRQCATTRCREVEAAASRSLTTRGVDARGSWASGSRSRMCSAERSSRGFGGPIRVTVWIIARASLR